MNNLLCVSIIDILGDENTKKLNDKMGYKSIQTQVETKVEYFDHLMISL